MTPPPSSKIRWWTRVDNEFSENCYVLAWPELQQCIVVDPGLQVLEIVALLRAESLEPAMILNTHGHADHIGGNSVIRDTWPSAEIAIGQGDACMLVSAELNLSAGFGLPVTSPPADRQLRHGDVVRVAGWEFEVRDAPGHSPGHVVYVCRQTTPHFVLAGDVLFQAGVGRTDFPGGSFDQLKESIRSQLYTLPDDTAVYSGHGAPTTIGHERRTNPFVRGAE